MSSRYMSVTGCVKPGTCIIFDVNASFWCQHDNSNDARSIQGTTHSSLEVLKCLTEKLLLQSCCVLQDMLPSVIRGPVRLIVSYPEDQQQHRPYELSQERQARCQKLCPSMFGCRGHSAACASHLDDGAAAKVGGKEVNMQGGRHEHYTQLRVLGQHIPQDDEQKVCKAVPLMDLINDHLRAHSRPLWMLCIVTDWRPGQPQALQRHPC